MYSRQRTVLRASEWPSRKSVWRHAIILHFLPSSSFLGPSSRTALEHCHPTKWVSRNRNRENGHASAECQTRSPPTICQSTCTTLVCLASSQRAKYKHPIHNASRENQRPVRRPLAANSEAPRYRSRILALEPCPSVFHALIG